MKKRKTTRAGIFLGMTVVLLFCASLGFHSISLRAHSLELIEQEEELTKKKEDLAKESESIQEQKAYMQTNEYVENVARDKFGLVYEDEIIFKAE